jgi:esterase
MSNLSREGRVEVNGLSLHYLEWGDEPNPPILLLHGFLSQAFIWQGLASSLSRNYRVLALNQRGHGQSDWSRQGDYSIDDHFADLVCFLEELNLTDVILVGHSMGGRNALFYAACRSERIKKLILVDARPGNSQQSVQALKQMLDFAEISALEIESFVTEANEQYPQLSLKSAFEKIRPDVHQTTTAEHDPWLVVASQLAENQVEDLWPFMKNVNCPTLIIRGETSTFVSPSDVEDMCRIIPNAEGAVIPQAGHLPMLENSSSFHRVILAFITGNRSV